MKTINVHSHFTREGKQGAIAIVAVILLTVILHILGLIT